MVDLQALNTELTTDPEGLGYSGSDARDADLMNDRGRSSETLMRRAIPMGEVYAQVEWIDEWLVLDEVRREGFRQITCSEFLDATSPRIQAALEAIFGSGSDTWANLAAIATRSASRAEVLFGEGTSVHHLDVAAARRL